MKVRALLPIAALSMLSAFACTSQSATKSKPTQNASATDPKTPVAKIGGVVVTNGELEESAKAELKRIDQEYQEQLYQVKQQALDRLIVNRLLEAKAKAAGKSADDYFKSEVTSKIADPTPAEMQAFYDQAKASGRELPPLDQIKDQLSNFLKQQKMQGATQAFYDKLKAEGKVEVMLPRFRPARVDVEAKGPSRGPANAPITIVEFSDYECPFCGRAEESITKVMTTYPDKVRVVYRDLPLPMHKNAPKAAEAAHCAGDQGKYWDMHAKLFANQRALEIANLKTYAKDLKLDSAKFDKCLDSGDKAKVVAENQKAGEALGINGTPAFFVNGILISGAQPFEVFKELIDEELASKKKS